MEKAIQTVMYDLTPALRLTDPLIWEESGVTDPEIAEQWWQAGFDAVEFADWGPVARYVLREEDVSDDQRAMVRIAQVWKVAGFTVDEVREWRDILTEVEDQFHLPLEARKWRVAGFDTNSASAWNHWDAPFAPEALEFAVLFENRGWYPAQARLMSLFMNRLKLSDRDDQRRAWLALDLDVRIVLDFIKAGISPSEAPIMARWHDAQHLEEELRAREALLPRIDTFTASFINRLNWMPGSDEYPKVFHGEHLHDFDDEELEEAEAQPDERPMAEDAAVQKRLGNLFGEPNEEGVYLVAVVEFSDDASEDQWSHAGNMLRGSVCVAAERLGLERRVVDLPYARDSMAVGILPDGTRLAATAEQVRACSSHLKSREPTEQERARWAGLPVSEPVRETLISDSSSSVSPTQRFREGRDADPGEST